ncbi:TPA: hypothetical protein ACULBH_001904 [Escherichia coli]
MIIKTLKMSSRKRN